MPRNAILVVNTDGSLHQRCRESIQHAAKRWGCQYAEMVVSPPTAPNINGLYLKCWAFDAVYGADRILSLDSDTMIREDAPNPFVEFPDPDKVYAVRDVQPTAEARRGIDEVLRAMPKSTLDLDRYFNAGVLLMGKSFGEVLKKNHSLLTVYNPRFWFDQHILNVLAQEYGLELISFMWNYYTILNNSPMEAYIYHWAGKCIPGKVQWRIKHE